MTIYFASGACSLIDEVVWVRLLKLTLGNTVYASSIVVSTFLGGLALGAAVMARFCDRIKRRLALYALLETLVSISALALPFCLRMADGLYVRFYRTFEPGHGTMLAVQVVVSAALLLVPSALMGSTLPLLGRFITGMESRTGSLVGKLYAFNTLGAATGCLLAGFVLIRVAGLMGTLYVAAGMNLAVAAGGWILSRYCPEEVSQVQAQPAAQNGGIKFPAAVLAGAFCVSGMVSIGYQLVWMRSIVHLLGGFTYVFSAVLTVYLAGNVIGAALGSGLVQRMKSPTAGFAACLMLLGACGIAYLPTLVLYSSGPVSTLAAAIGKGSTAYLLGPLVHCTILFLPASVVMGTGFPLALQSWAGNVHLVGRSTGSAYAVNTAGAVAGGLLTGFVLIKLLGVQASMNLLGFLALWSGAAVMMVHSRATGGLKRWAGPAVAACITAFAAAVPTNLFAAIVGTSPIFRVSETELVAVREGLTTTVSVHRSPEDGALHLYSSGQSIAGDDYVERGDQTMLGHFAVLLNARSTDVLSVGFGSGQTTECLSRYGLERIDCVEIAPEVPEVSLVFFRHINLGEDLDRFVNMIYADARNYLHLTDRRYDVIINDSIHPRDFADNASLYTLEYFQAALQRLKPGGMVISWLPIYHMPEAVFASILGTSMQASRHVTVWYLAVHPAPLVLVACSNDPQRFDPAAIDRWLSVRRVSESIAPINIGSSADVLSCYVCDKEGLAATVGSYAANSDYRPFVEFNTELNASNEEILARFALPCFDGSIEDHLDLSGMGDQKTRWLKRLNAARRSARAVLAAEATADPLEKLRIIAAALTYKGQEVPLKAAYEKAQKLLFTESIRMIAAGRADQALELARKILVVDEKAALAYLIRAAVFQHEGLNEMALEAAGRAVSLHPNNADAHFALAIALFRAGRFDQAAASYQAALEKTPTGAAGGVYQQIQILDAMAAAQAAAGNTTQAVATIKKAMELARPGGHLAILRRLEEQLEALEGRN